MRKDKIKTFRDSKHLKDGDTSILPYLYIIPSPVLIQNTNKIKL